jgi:peptidoglycan/xylan/chitin deacetylase (PgdA/CDA1 family)
LELAVGITEMRPGWSTVLHQIGVPYQKVELGQPIDPDKVTVLILSSIPTADQKENLYQFLKSGGAILSEANFAASFLNLQLKEIFIKYLHSNQDSVFSNVQLCDLEMECEIAMDAQHLPNQGGVKTVAIQNYQNGKIVILPSNFCKRLIEPRIISRRNFPPLTQKFPSERVSQVSTGSIRHIIQRALEHLFHSRELPFAQTWFFPKGEKNIFAFRVDTDSASKAEIEELYQICRRNDISATWFVDTKSHQNWIGYFSEMENQEIGHHCYEHRVYSDSYATRLDMEKGLSILKKTGVTPTGYAAPFGEWNSQLGQLIPEIGFAYSSEFGCAYDDLPFFPHFGTVFSKTLQVPIHPVSTRRLQLAKYNATQMVDYYLGVIQQKLFLNDPVIFYDHPIHGHFRIFEQIFSEVRKKNILNMTLLDYQSWWRKRLNAGWRATFERGKLAIRSSNSDASIWLKLTYPDGKELLMPLDNPGKQIPFENESQTLPYFDVTPKELRRYNLKMLWHDIESLYGKLR